MTETVEWECVDCDDFELSKRYSGEAGTPGKEEYDRIEAPDDCPACGGEVQQVATDGGREIPTVPPEKEPEFVGSHSALVSQNCQHWIGETTDDIDQCGRSATHTIVMADGSGLHEIASCDECGSPDDVEHGERKWTGEVREDKQRGTHEYGPDPMPDGGTPMASTIVGDPQHPAETADMTPYDGPPEDFERADPREIDCPRGHAEAGEPCWVVESTDRDVYCAARQRQAGRGNDE